MNTSAPTRLFRIIASEGPALWAIPAVASSATAGSLFHPLTPQDQLRFSTDPCCWLTGDSSLNIDSTNPVLASKVLAPIAPEYPPAVYVIGLNYRKHAAETGNKEPLYPIIVGCSPSSVIGSGADIELPVVCDVDEVDYEAELAIVIGKKAKNVSEEDAMSYVAGFTCANDVSARRWQGPKRGSGQWSRAKNFDTFAPLGPALVRPHKEFNPNNAKISSTVSGQVMQDSNTIDMIFNVQKLVSFMSQSTTLLPWTVILTGTPEGVGYTRKPPRLLVQGDNTVINIDGIGELINNVVDLKLLKEGGEPRSKSKL